MKPNRKKLLKRIALIVGGLFAVIGLAAGYIGFWQFEVLPDQKIPMRDGKYFVAHITKKRFGGSGPVVLMLSPYNPVDIMGKVVAGFGYPLVQASCRGTGGSEDEFIPFERDGKDGYDVVEWIAKQPWCDGRVAMAGGSYNGMTQWLTLKERPPHLKAIVPMASAAPGIDMPISRNISSAYWLRWVDYVQGNTTIQEFWYDKNVADLDSLLYVQHLPFGKADSINANGNRNSVFQRWLAHPTFDAYWQHILPAPEDYAKIDIPILSVTGYFDGDQRGALHYYQNHLRYGTLQAINNHHLIIGPYNHLQAQGDPGAGETVGGVLIEKEALVSLASVVGGWLDWKLKGKEKPEFLKNRANYFMMNANEWRAAGSLNEIPTDTMNYYLSGKLTTDTRKPALTARSMDRKLQVSQSEYDSLINDPLALSKASLQVYQSFSWQDIIVNDTLVTLPQRIAYYTPVLSEDMELAGAPVLELYASLSTPDTDLELSLYEIDSTGKSFYLTSDAMRVRYRNSFEKEELAVPEKVYKLQFNNFFFIAKKIIKGSRLRIVINPLVEPGTQKNYNAGGDLRYESGKDARTCIIKLYHDSSRPSRLKLPLVKKSTAIVRTD